MYNIYIIAIKYFGVVELFLYITVALKLYMNGAGLEHRLDLFVLIMSEDNV